MSKTRLFFNHARNRRHLEHLKHNRIGRRIRGAAKPDPNMVHWFDVLFAGWMKGIKKIIVTKPKEEGTA